ncbi:hypothetical protein V6N13_021339 [Hibiscus sabdariffa]
MAISFLSQQWQSLQVLFFILNCVFASYIRAQPSSGDGANFWCSELSAPCSTYAAYFAQEPDFLDLQDIAKLFGTSPQEIARASNLVSEDTRLFPGQLLLVPITCGCTMNHYFANTTYDIKLGDTYYIVSTTVFESLTNITAVEQMNPSLEPKNLHAGDEVVFPLFCKCPSKAESDNGTSDSSTDDPSVGVTGSFSNSPLSRKQLQRDPHSCFKHSRLSAYFSRRVNT